MERYLIATNPTTSVTFAEDGATVDPGVVTLTIAREDGTEIAAGLVTTGTGAAARTYNLTAATHTDALDVLRLDWESSTKGTITTYAEIVGGFLVSLARMRAEAALTSETAYPTAKLIAARTSAEVTLEDACGVAFVPRYFRTKVDGNDSCDLLVNARPLSVTAVTVRDSGTLSSDDLAALELYPDGRIWRESEWPAGRRNIEIKGIHGYVIPPAGTTTAVLELAKRILIESPMDPRTVSVTGESSTVQLFREDGTFGIPAADEVVVRYGLNYGVG